MMRSRSSRKRKGNVVEVAPDQPPPLIGVVLSSAAARILIEAVQRGNGVAWAGNQRALDADRVTVRVTGRWNVLMSLVTAGMMTEPQIRRAAASVVHRFDVTDAGRDVARKLEILREWRRANPRKKRPIESLEPVEATIS